MTKDIKDDGTQAPSFRDQILRDLEDLKAQRSIDEQTVDSAKLAQAVVNETATSEPVFPTTSEKVSIGEMTFPYSYLKEETSSSDIPVHFKEPEEVTSKEPEEVSATVQQYAPVEEPLSFSDSVEPHPFQDTIERNLEELRNLVAATAGPSSETSTNQMEHLWTENTSSFGKEEPKATIEDTFIDFPTEDVSGVTGDTEIMSLEQTIVAPKPTPVATNDVANKARRRSATKQKRKKQEKTAKRIVGVVMSVVIISLLAVGIVGYSWISSSLKPVDVKATEAILVEIPQGSSTLDIGKILEENQLIKNATVFNYYSKIKSYNNFQSGFYNLKQSMSVDEIAKALQDSGTATAQEPVAGKILIVEGYTLAQIAEAVAKNTLEGSDGKTPFTAEQFMATVQNQEFINRMVAAYPRLFASLPTAESGVINRLEGYLFPAVYDYYDETTIEDLVEKMISTTDARLQPYYDQIAAKNLTVNDVLTLASLVEKEGSTDEDRRTIASVFYNRLNIGMPLQSNIAILYAQGKLGQATTLAEDAGIDTSIESPYNIYWRTGLMPGPVDSPSLSAIEAVINPNQTEYLYFVADVTTGTVYYSTTIEGHDENVAKYVNSHLNN